MSYYCIKFHSPFLSLENAHRIQQLHSTLNLGSVTFRKILHVFSLQTECGSYRNEIETLKSEIVSLININEDNTRRIDEFDNDKFNFEQEINEKDRQITERDEKVQETELLLKQTQESNAKLRKALQKTKEHTTDNEQTHTQDAGKISSLFYYEEIFFFRKSITQTNGRV